MGNRLSFDAYSGEMIAIWTSSDSYWFENAMPIAAPATFLVYPGCAWIESRFTPAIMYALNIGVLDIDI